MNKIKLFGCALMGAFMAFNLASCEKENFSTSTDVTVTPPTINIPGVEMPETYQPGDAVVSIQPTVNALINGSISNVTESATIKIGGKTTKYDVITGKTIAAQEITISVSYTVVIEGFEKILEATEKVHVPAMEAGMVAIITPTIWVSINSKGYIAQESEEKEDDVVKKNISIVNVENVWYPQEEAVIKFVKEGSYVKDLKYAAGYENDSEVKAEVEKITKGMSKELEYATAEVKVDVYAQSQTIIPISQSIISTDYEIKKMIEWSRAADEKVVATFTVVEYGAFTIHTNEIKTNINLKGEEYGHGHAGHGDGHGHGSLNAGGSIVDAL